MIITLKDFINSNIDNKTTLENNISSEVILGSENYFMFLAVMQHNGALEGYIFKNNNDLQANIKDLATKLVDLQDKARAFIITQEERLEWSELEQELLNIIEQDSIEDLELAGCKSSFANTNLVML